MGKKKIDIKTLIQNKSLTIKDLVLYIKSKLLFVLMIMLFFGVLGFLRGVSVTDEFSSSSQLLPENSTSTASNVANLMGIVPNQMRQPAANTAAVPVDLYPRIVLSDNFLYDLIENKYLFANEGMEISLKDYFSLYYEEDILAKAKKIPAQWIDRFRQKKTTLSDSTALPIDSVTNPQADSLISAVTVLDFNSKERKAISSLRERIAIVKTDQLFELRTTMPDPNVAALLNKDIVEKLINFVGERQIEKETTNFNFLREQKKIVASRYQQAQASLAHYRDHNRGLISNQAKGTENQLKNEYELAYTLYNQLSQQLEVARVKLEEARPIITVLQNPLVPIAKVNAGPVGVTIIFTIAGAFIAFAIIGIRLFIYFANYWLNGESS